MNDTPLPGNTHSPEQDANGHLGLGSEAYRFHNALRILLCTDRDELERAGVIETGPAGFAAWLDYLSEPLTFIVRLADEKFMALWAIIESRQPARGGAHVSAS
jgi:hypothetical protein